MAARTAAEAIAGAQRAAAPTPAQTAAAKKQQPSISHLTELEPEVPVQSIKVDGLAVMKIVKHAREAALSATSASAAGQLLGLDSAGVLNVSDVFPLPSGSLSGGSDGDESRGSKSAARYTSAILPRLSALGSDANLVGFYMSTTNGQHLATPGFLEALIAVQLGSAAASAASRAQTPKTPKSAVASASKALQGGKGVALVYDAASSSQGTVNLKAYKLSQAFIDAHRAGRFDSQSLLTHKLTQSNIIEEVPLTIQSNALLTAFLSTLIAPQSGPSQKPANSLTSQPASRSSRLPTAVPSYAPLGLPSASDAEAPAPLTETVSALIASLDAHNAALSTLSFQSRQWGRDRARLEGVIAKRKADNELRAQQGLPPLPPSAEEAALREPSRLETMCALSGVDGAAKTLSEVTGTGLVRAYASQGGVSSA